MGVYQSSMYGVCQSNLYGVCQSMCIIQICIIQVFLLPVVGLVRVRVYVVYIGALLYCDRVLLWVVILVVMLVVLLSMESGF